MFNLNFTGLDNSRTYTITLTAHRADTTAPNVNRWSKFTIADAGSFTNASSTGTQNNGGGTPATASQVWFNTGNNTTGLVAKWTGVSPGVDGDFTVQTTYIVAPSGTTDTSSYAPAMVKLDQVVSGAAGPSAPTAVTAAAATTTSASVSWAAPAGNGGSAITGYRITP